MLEKPRLARDGAKAGGPGAARAIEGEGSRKGTHARLDAELYRGRDGGRGWGSAPSPSPGEQPLRGPRVALKGEGEVWGGDETGGDSEPGLCTGTTEGAEGPWGGFSPLVFALKKDMTVF